MHSAIADTPDYNHNGVPLLSGMPRPSVRGKIIDFHCHLIAARHAQHWFEAADLYHIDAFANMTPLENTAELRQSHGSRLLFIAVPSWQHQVQDPIDDYLRRLEAFYAMGTRIVKFHFAPESIRRRGMALDSAPIARVFEWALARGMGVMTHVGDPDAWYQTRYADPGVYGTREAHYRAWENVLERYRGTPWIGAHMGGHPEDLNHLQQLLDRFPDLRLDCSATKWIARTVSAQAEKARDFFIRNQDRILFGSDQVSGDERSTEFFASRFWVQRTLWETSYEGESPIRDSDVPGGGVVRLRGLHLPPEVLQKLYHDNAVRYLRELNVDTRWLD
jgi:predicted TIM-barrel fold metal-dependent hydrolase